MIPYINIHTHRSNQGQFCIINPPSNSIMLDNEHYSYGIHPWDIGIVETKTEVEKLISLSNSKKIIAVGEIGLDRAIQTSFNIQQDVFIEQLEIANKFDLPVIIHCVKAYSDILALKKNKKNHTAWILHGFTGNSDNADKLLKAGCYLSFGSKLLINQSVQSVFKLSQFNRVFLETDDSDSKIEEIYDKAAELYNISIKELKSLIYNNFVKVFGKECITNG